MTTTQNKPEHFVAFYFVEGFWAGSKPEYSHFRPLHHLSDGIEYAKLMERQVLEVEDDGQKIIMP